MKRVGWFRMVGWWLIGGGLALSAALPARGLDCTLLLTRFQAGWRDNDIAVDTGTRISDVSYCRRELSRPELVGPAGPVPRGAAGQPPHGAAGPPPHGAAGPPPHGAAGPSTASRQVKRLP